MGYNITIFAYGQTASGKTYSMGTSYSGGDNAGIIPRAILDIFTEKKDNTCYELSITVSFMELYQEILYDLLSSRSREDSVLELREDSKKGFYVPGLREIPVETAQELLNVLQKGSSGRATGTTAMNAQSSRSHAICWINVAMNHKTDSRKNKMAKLNLVDLAVSERQKRTDAVGNTFKEAININKGLLVLGNVINCLADDKSPNIFIPCLNSNLTRLLKESLSGNNATLMIACVSPAEYNCNETLSTLRYADRARAIKHIVKVQGDPMVCPGQMEILDLKEQLEKVMIQLSTVYL